MLRFQKIRSVVYERSVTVQRIWPTDRGRGWICFYNCHINKIKQFINKIKQFITGLFTVPGFPTRTFDLRYNFLILQNLINLGGGDPMNPRNEDNSPFRHRQEPILPTKKSLWGIFLDFGWKTTPPRKVWYFVLAKLQLSMCHILKQL